MTDPGVAVQRDSNALWQRCPAGIWVEATNLEVSFANSMTILVGTRVNGSS